MKYLLKNSIYKRINLNGYFSFLTRKWTREANHIFIACLPKSGSTFISDTLVNITSYDFVQFQPIRGTNDHNIDKGFFLENLNKNTVTQLHVKPNSHNKLIIKKYNIKVVFLYRSITASLKSFHRHILEENNQWFMFSMADDYNNWDNEAQMNFIIDLVLPWYLNFLVSWKNELKKKEIKILEIDYDDFKSDNSVVLNKILKFYNISKPEEEILDGLNMSYNNKENLRFNSQSYNYNFTPEQLKKISSMINYYSEHKLKI